MTLKHSHFLPPLHEKFDFIDALPSRVPYLALGTTCIRLIKAVSYQFVSENSSVSFLNSFSISAHLFQGDLLILNYAFYVYVDNILLKSV